MKIFRLEFSNAWNDHSLFMYSFAYSFISNYLNIHSFVYSFISNHLYIHTFPIICIFIHFQSFVYSYISNHMHIHTFPIICIFIHFNNLHIQRLPCSNIWMLSSLSIYIFSINLHGEMLFIIIIIIICIFICFITFIKTLVPEGWWVANGCSQLFWQVFVTRGPAQMPAILCSSFVMLGLRKFWTKWWWWRTVWSNLPNLSKVQVFKTK